MPCQLNLSLNYKKHHGFPVTMPGTAAKKAVRKHDKSTSHNESISAKNRPTENDRSAVVLSDKTMKERKVNRRALEIIFDAIKLLERQGLALRGHDDENSNVYQALQFVKKYNPDIGSWLGRSSRLKWLSHDIQNEILRLYSHDILRRLVSKIQRAKFFSLIADETSDISRKEQVSICVRFVDEQFNIEEAFMGFAETPLANAKTLVQILSSFICSVGLDISHCRGQSYDGAANMSGHLNGVKRDSVTSTHQCFLCIALVTKSIWLFRMYLDAQVVE